MKIGYVVLYVSDPEASLNFWIEKIGLVEKSRTQVGSLAVVKVGFANQDFSFELVPLELMQENPDGLNLGSPSIAFYVSSLDQTHAELSSKGVECVGIGEHSGLKSFAFADNENRWFAVIEG